MKGFTADSCFYDNGVKEYKFHRNSKVWVNLEKAKYVCFAGEIEIYEYGTLTTFNKLTVIYEHGNLDVVLNNDEYKKLKESL